MQPPSLSAPELDRRATLLAHNAGTWEGCFLRFDGRGQEQERFASRLTVEDHQGTVVAALTNLSTGRVRSMDFQEPPPEMQISLEGHWSLGPDRIGPWPWVSELCLVWGERRRRAVIRHGSTQLESLVLVSEGRPGHQEAVPPSPLQMLAAAGDAGHASLWTVPAPLGVTLQTMGGRVPGVPETVALRWQPAPGISLEIQRRYGSHGLLEPL